MSSGLEQVKGHDSSGPMGSGNSHTGKPARMRAAAGQRFREMSTLDPIPLEFQCHEHRQSVVETRTDATYHGEVSFALLIQPWFPHRKDGSM